METNVRGSDRRRRVTRPAVFLFAAVLVVGVFAAMPASARLLPPLPPLPPLPLPTSSTGLDLDLNDTINSVTGLLNDVPDQLGAIVEDTTASLTAPGTDPEPNPAPPPQNPVQGPLTGSWSVAKPPAGLQSPVTSTVDPRVSGARYRRSLSYGAALSEGFRAATGRAAALAGPLAAPIALALVAVGLLAVAARGPGRLVKVEEERQSTRARRSYRL